MTFQQFLETHFIADFIWEIFKGVSPTIIALITIWINTIIGKKKVEKEKLANEIKELQLMVSNIMTYVEETKDLLSEAIQNAGKESSVELEAYHSKNKQMLKESRKYLEYANIRAEILKKKNIRFDDAYIMIANYACELINILVWYKTEKQEILLNDFEVLICEFEHELIDATTNVENVLIDYCMKMACA